jgi:hypothetical protein
MGEPDLHPAVVPIAGLIGRWSGAGRGEYPTIESFEYIETVEFGHVGKPFLTYVQRTRDAHDGAPLHAESGYLRPVRPGWIEAVFAHPNGIVEVSEGPIDGPTIRLTSIDVERTPTAKEVTHVERDVTVEGDALRYQLRMAAVGQPLLFHLAAELRRD